jgi:hypothetical protein
MIANNGMLWSMRFLITSSRHFSRIAPGRRRTRVYASKVRIRASVRPPELVFDCTLILGIARNYTRVSMHAIETYSFSEIAHEGRDDQRDKSLSAKRYRITSDLDVKCNPAVVAVGSESMINRRLLRILDPRSEATES